MKKFKSFCEKHLRKAVVLAVVMSLTVVAASAEEAAAGGIDTAAITSAMTTGLTSVVTMSIQLITSILPIAITLFGIMFLVKKAPKWFQKMAG